MKVLIVDDEIKICQLIQLLINWESLGLTVIGIADTGISAFEIVKNEHPDIVITDIKMPGCDGLELTQMIYNFNPSINVVIISGYQDFEYARTAMKYGVRYYLSKPINQDDVYNTLIKLVENIKTIKQESAHYQTLKIHEQEKRKERNESFIHDLLHSKNTALDNESLKQMYQLDFPESSYACFLIKPDFPVATDSCIYENMLLNIKEISEQVLAADIPHSICCIDNYCLYILLNTSKSNNIKRYLIRIVNQSNMIKKIPQMTIYAYFSNIFSQFGDIFQQFQNLHCSMLDRIISRHSDYIIEVPSRNQRIINPNNVLNDSIRNRVFDSVKFHDQKSLSALILDLKSFCLEKHFRGMEIYELTVEFLNTVLLGIKYLDSSYDTGTPLSQFINGYSLFTSVEEVFTSMQTLIDAALQNQTITEISDDADPIKIVKQYINKHLSDTISLGQLSNLTDFNASYLSSLFRNKTGQTITEYIQHTRIEKAKELLSNTDLKIVSVAEKIGIPDSRYFSKVFKKETGLTPAQYRNYFLRQE